MSLKDRLAAERKPEGTAFGRWVDALPDEDKKALLAAAPDNSLSHQAVLRAVKDEGARVTKDTIAAWRKANGFTR